MHALESAKDGSFVKHSVSLTSNTMSKTATAGNKNNTPAIECISVQKPCSKHCSYITATLILWYKIHIITSKYLKWCLFQVLKAELQLSDAVFWPYFGALAQYLKNENLWCNSSLKEGQIIKYEDKRLRTLQVFNDKAFWQMRIPDITMTSNRAHLCFEVQVHMGYVVPNHSSQGVIAQ